MDRDPSGRKIFCVSILRNKKKTVHHHIWSHMRVSFTSSSRTRISRRLLIYYRNWNVKEWTTKYGNYFLFVWFIKLSLMDLPGRGPTDEILDFPLFFRRLYGLPLFYSPLFGRGLVVLRNPREELSVTIK